MPNFSIHADEVRFMIDTSYANQHALTPYTHSAPATATRSIRSIDDSDPVELAFHTYMDRMQSEFRDGSLSAGGRELANAAVRPGKAGALGVQVSTFAVDSAQAKDIVMVKRTPETAEGPNFLMYVPEQEGHSFHEFNTREEMTASLKASLSDPKARDKFAAHFSSDAAPKQEERVQQVLEKFAAGDQAVLGSYGYEKGDIFARLNQDVSTPPVPVNGLTNTRLNSLSPDGRATYIGTREDGNKVIYAYDGYGNLLGGASDGLYLVRNGLNNNEPLELRTPEEHAKYHASTLLDNTEANDLNGLYDEFLKQLRNPGHGLGTALKELGVSEDVANSIEKILKNPVTGTLLELNQENRLGNLFGVKKEVMDEALEKIGNEAQSRIPIYGSKRQQLEGVADLLENQFGTPKPPTVQVHVG